MHTLSMHIGIVQTASQLMDYATHFTFPQVRSSLHTALSLARSPVEPVLLFVPVLLLPPEDFRVRQYGSVPDRDP